MGYLGDWHYPCVVDGKRAVQVAYHEILASAIAISEYHKMDCSKDGSIGIILNLMPTYPKDYEKENVKAANIQDLFYNRAFLDPSVLGEYPQELISLLKENGALPKYEQKDIETIKENTVDFLGVNYYCPRRAQARTEKLDVDVFTPEKYFENYVWPMAKMNKYRG